jgi:hypothetical protein
MAKIFNPTKDPEFKRVLGNLLSAPPKLHAEMKIGKSKTKSKKEATACKANRRLPVRSEP